MQELTVESKQQIETNLAKVRDRIEAACARSERDPAEVRLVAVTKTQPTEVIPYLLELGVDAIGESRPEIAAQKQAELDCDVPWHMIGHYQRKKLKRTLGLFEAVHSVHSLALLSSVDHAVGDAGIAPANILLQVNIAEEPQKQGFAPRDVRDVCDLARAFTRVRLSGLMAMAPRTNDTATCRGVFRKLRALQEEIGKDLVPELSIGMSQDFETAIEEGATMIRVGSVLFDGLQLDR